MLSTKMVNFLMMSWFISTMICLILEGIAWSNHETGTIISDLSLTAPYNVPVLGEIRAFNVGFFSGLARIVLFDYSFYEGQYQLIRWFWMAILTPGFIWGLVQTFINLLPTLISVLRSLLPVGV